MSAAANKQLLQHIFDELSKGNGQPFVDSLTDDFRWTITGSNAWSRTYAGKHAVRTEFLGPLFAQFADQYTNRAHRFIAEDDLVVVECLGKVHTKSGHPYCNAYCWIFRLEEGRVKELTEYMDSHLAMSLLKPPVAA